MQRIKQYGQLSTSLACLSNVQLIKILHEGQPLHEGIGGKSSLIYIDEKPVFVKKVPLTDLEQLPQNFMSTANLFDLPLSYQYGVGSTGFGVWREVATHIMTTNLVITDECANFPMMYHWRILPNTPTDINSWDDLEQHCKYWEQSAAIRKRALDLNKATAHIALFLEYVPQNLHDWLRGQIEKGGNAAEAAVAFVEEQLTVTTRCMNTHGLMHFDAHFKNILTDGERLYFSDFGLALSSQFDLSIAETQFLKQHRLYDQACAAVNLLHCLITSLFGYDHWEIRLQQYLAGELCGEFSNVPPTIKRIIHGYAPIALLMDEFFQKLQKESKLTAYPATQLEKLLTIYE